MPLSKGEQQLGVSLFAATSMLCLFFGVVFTLEWFCSPSGDEHSTVFGAFSMAFWCGMLVSMHYLRIHFHRLRRPDR